MGSSSPAPSTQAKVSVRDGSGSAGQILSGAPLKSSNIDKAPFVWYITKSNSPRFGANAMNYIRKICVQLRKLLRETGPKESGCPLCGKQFPMQAPIVHLCPR
jgi:hypothetical protein